MKQRLTFLVIVIFVAMGLFCWGACSDSENEPTVHDVKAAIVDQLTPLYPNDEFIKEITRQLEDYGFEVDVYSGDEITVDFYRTLPAHEYKLIILRSHSGLLGVDPKVTNKTWIFTNEQYSQNLHVTEQLSDRLTYGKITEDSEWVFTLSADFITGSTEGDFADTVVIMMGCSGLYRTDLAKAFVQKGASVFIGWNDSVLLSYVDKATGTLLENLCTEELSIAGAVADTAMQVGLDPEYGAALEYFPIPGDYKTLSQIIE